jgi:hypothetical protein
VEGVDPELKGERGLCVPFSAASHTGSPSNASPSRSRLEAEKITTVVCGVAASVASASRTCNTIQHRVSIRIGLLTIQ